MVVQTGNAVPSVSLGRELPTRTTFRPAYLWPRWATTLALAVIGLLFGAIFGYIALLLTHDASRQAERMYVDLYGFRGSTDFSIGLFFGTYFIFPVAMAFLLGVCGPILYRALLHRNVTGITLAKAFTIGSIVAAASLVVNFNPLAKIPIFWTVFLPVSLIAGIETFLFCIVLDLMLHHDQESITKQKLLLALAASAALSLVLRLLLGLIANSSDNAVVQLMWLGPLNYAPIFIYLGFPLCYALVNYLERWRMKDLKSRTEMYAGAGLLTVALYLVECGLNADGQVSEFFSRLLSDAANPGVAFNLVSLGLLCVFWVLYFEGMEFVRWKVRRFAAG
jgi:hypothetical protein